MQTVIVVSIDGCEGEGQVLAYVSRLARETEASVRLLMVRPPLSVVVSGRGVLDRVARGEARRRAAARLYLDRFADRLAADGVRVDTELRFGAGGATLAQVVRETGAQVVIAPTSQGRWLEDEGEVERHADVTESSAICGAPKWGVAAALRAGLPPASPWRSWPRGRLE